MHSYHVWFFIISMNTIHANFDIDINLLLKICNMKFCDATKTDVSKFLFSLEKVDLLIIIIIYFSSILSNCVMQCDLNYCNKQMSSEIKFGDCPRMVNNTETETNNSCFDDCLNDYR